MNNDLISREALKKAFEDTVCIEPMPYAFVKQIIDNAPTVDIDLAEYSDKLWKGAYERGKNERPQGEWIMNKTSARGRNYTCTNCKKVSRNKFDFCPMCGADMREGRQ